MQEMRCKGTEVLLFRRKVYDQTGSLDDSDELAGEQFDSLYKYYRGLYRKVTLWYASMLMIEASILMLQKLISQKLSTQSLQRCCQTWLHKSHRECETVLQQLHKAFQDFRDCQMHAVLFF